MPDSFAQGLSSTYPICGRALRVNGRAATVRALPGGSPYLLSKELALAAGTHEITVNAQDQANNTTL